MTMSVSRGRPSVRVPVLSKATTCVPASTCNATPFLNRTPSSAALPVPTMIETGVAKPIAQGQAMISTATALTTARPSAGRVPNANQARNVSAATPSTTGTKTATTLSSNAWMGSLAPCAACTMAMT